MTVNTVNPVTLTVIIPTYRRPEALRRILATLENQISKNPHYDIIVVNDGSHDSNYADIVRRHPYINYIVHKENRGGGAARNSGARQATGRYLVFTDDDCIPPAYWLDWLVAVIQEYPFLAAICGTTRLPSIQSPSIFQLYVSYAGITPRPGFIGGRLRVMPTANLAIDSNWFQKAGGFDENRSYGNDVLLTQRLVELGAPIHIEYTWVTCHEHYGLFGVLSRTFRYGKSHGWRLAIFNNRKLDGEPIQSFRNLLKVLYRSAWSSRNKQSLTKLSLHERFIFRIIDVIRNILSVTGRWRGYKIGLKLRKTSKFPVR